MTRIIPVAGAERIVGVTRRRAFTAVELSILLIAVAVVGLLAARQVVRARRVVREELALQNLRTLGTGCRFYARATQQMPDTLARLVVEDPPYVPAALAGAEPVKQGYAFRYTRSTPSRFRIWADPVEHGATGSRHFVIDETLTVHATLEDRQATLSDPVYH